MTNSAFCLRVIQGLHQGASVPLAEFPAGLQIAPDGLADVLLRDAPGVARMSLIEGAWHWQEDDFSHVLNVGTTWRWGGLVLSLMTEETPWPQALPPLSFERTNLSPLQETDTLADESRPKATDDQADELLDLAELDSGLQTKQLAPSMVRSSGRLSASRVVLVVIALICVVLVGLALASLAVAPSVGQTPITTSDGSNGPPDMKQVREVLLGLDLEELLDANLRSNGRLVVKGVVPDDERLERLATALRKLSRNTSLMVITQDEFVARVKNLQNNLPEGIRAFAQDGGQLWLEALDDSVNWELAYQLVDGEIPEVVRIDNGVLNPTSQPYKKNAALPVEQSVQDLAFPVIPRIVAIIGGAQPYLMLAEGQKWLIGGKISGLTLQAIEDQSLVFEDARATLWRRPR